ncbi:alanine racemase [Paraperlucidibaca baekdonensis]|uniref:Alanine racemase n=1 Tax=Paraperlucidibaca baekdonensis TaxID=748120 RepID=A0A3E0H854_9GAMM|nr:alanine racemase [Paraperlucidibaca baekdonensis]REH39918.1 alanine racemase [Paraperlucidibaca baekdonensis]
MRDCWLTLDPQALAHNVSVLREHMPEAKLLAMVKADAYGHGMVTVARHLVDHVDGLGVACMSEALALREHGVGGTITVMEGVFNAEELAQARAKYLTLVMHSPEQLAVLEADEATGPLAVWLKVNTGMNRLGFRPTQALLAWRRIGQCVGVHRLGLMTHFACADEPVLAMTDQQIGRFRALQQALSADKGGPVAGSLANSAAVLAWPEAADDWVRPGIALYGSSPFADRSAAQFGLRPAMTLRARVISVFTVSAGERVGYGASWQAPQSTRIAVVSVGYGDGYPRHAATGTPVLINARRHPLVGRVSMDMITVQVDDSVNVGDEVVLWGEGLPADEVATAAGTISYELFCRLTPRVRRTEIPANG